METTTLLENIRKTSKSNIKKTVRQLDNIKLRSMYKTNKYLIFENDGKTAYYSDCTEPTLISIDLNYFRTKQNIIEEIEDIIIGEFVNKHKYKN